MVPFTLYLPSAVKEMTFAPSPAVSVALPAAVGALDEAVRRQPDVKLPLLGGGQLRHRTVGSDVPRLVAVHLRVLLLSAEDRLREVQLLARRDAVS